MRLKPRWTLVGESPHRERRKGKHRSRGHATEQLRITSFQYILQKKECTRKKNTIKLQIVGHIVQDPWEGRKPHR